jgi:hypothetical protein
MQVYEKLNRALEIYGIPRPVDNAAYAWIGKGAWHDAYLAMLPSGHRLVIRLRKEIVYDQRERFDERALKEEYEPVRLYYEQANRCQPGICPRVYLYWIEPGLIFTLESYMGASLELGALDERQARVFGRRVGRFFRKMHDLPAPVPGYGDLVWAQGRGEGELRGEDPRPVESIWEEDRLSYTRRLGELQSAGVPLDPGVVGAKLEMALNERTFTAESVTLVNGDITPENFIGQEGGFTGLVDPQVRLNNGTRYAAFFVYCYQALLPALYAAPRYARHQFDRRAPVLGAISEGYLEGYARVGEDRLRHQIGLEYYLYVFNLAYSCYQDLGSELDQEAYLRKGTKQDIRERLLRCLRELETIRLA